MDFLNGKIKTIYFKYLSAAFGSALITSIYSIVDMAMVGQYHGPEGSAALAVVAPVWNIIYSFGLLMGIGGSVLFSTIRGKADGDIRKSNEYFTASVIGSIVLALIIWVMIICFDRQLLLFFGAQDNTLTLAREYVRPIKLAIPFFLFNQMLAAYLRNDKNPALATGAVLAGGIFNIFGDYFFVFVCDMGAYGAGLATAIGSAISFLAMLSHFFMKKNTLRLVKPERILYQLKEIIVTGFSTFFIDVAMGILTMLFNRQIMAYLGTDAPGGVWCHRQRIHLCPVLCIQRRTGCPAHFVGQFWRWPRHAYPKGAELLPLVRRFFWPCLDWADHGRSQPVHPYLYVSDQRDSVYRSGHHPLLCSILLAASLQYLFHLLFPGADETGDVPVCFSCTRPCNQRTADLPAARACGRRFAVVCQCRLQSS